MIIYNLIISNYKIFSNYINGLKTSVDEISLEINFKGLSNIETARKQALKRGYISQDDQKLGAKGKIYVENKSYDVSVNPTGYNLDMIGDINKRAHKIKVKGEGKVYGMKEFKLLPPKSREFVVEWIIHQMMKREE